MKSMKQVLTFAISSLLPLYANAAFVGDVNCPPISAIANTKFTTVAPATDVQNGWGAYGKVFHYNNKEWYVLFGVILPVNNGNELLEKIQTFFDTRVSLSDPYSSSRAKCTYAEAKDYYVVAFDDPEHLAAR